MSGQHVIISIGVTGKIGSGKTVVAEYFKSIGYPVLFMDIVGHRILEEKRVIDKLTGRFGNSILDKNDFINRKRLGKIVFSDLESLKYLNGIVHPEMNEYAKTWIHENAQNGYKICFLEAAILFEMKMDEFLERILYIELTEEEIIKRTVKREKMSEEEIRKILSSQYVEEEKIDYVIDNSGSLEDLYLKCEEFEKDVLSYWKNQ